MCWWEASRLISIMGEFYHRKLLFTPDMRSSDLQYTLYAVLTKLTAIVRQSESVFVKHMPLYRNKRNALQMSSKIIIRVRGELSCMSLIKVTSRSLI